MNVFHIFTTDHFATMHTCSTWSVDIDACCFGVILPLFVFWGFLGDFFVVVFLLFFCGVFFVNFFDLVFVRFNYY